MKQSLSNTSNQKKSYVITPVDTIDDIYSDFDLRDLSIRSLSDDFIKEVKNQSRTSEPRDKIVITIMAPLKVKQKEFTKKIQTMTKKRIRGFFNEQYNTARYQRKITLLKSFLFISGGLTCFFITKMIPITAIHNLLLKTLYELTIFLSWFATWNGIDTLSEIGKRQEIQLLKRISVATVQFSFVKKFGL